MSKIEVSFVANGIGPHYGYNRLTNNKFSTGALNIAVYAENGTGKTFLSRMFALSENDKSVADTDRLLSIGNVNGEFVFTVKEPTSTSFVHKYSVNINKGSSPKVVIEGKQYKYHVFNHDYIVNNLEKSEYSPDGNITGYIIGRENIDVSSEKKEKKEAEDDRQSEIDIINKEINKAKNDLKNKNVNGSLTEYKRFNIDNVVNCFNTDEIESFASLSEQYIKLKSIPENIPNLVVMNYGINTQFFEQIIYMLSTSYSKAKFDEEAMRLIKKVQNDPNFYNKGIIKYEGSSEPKCPFCNQTLSEYGIYVINLYKEYFDQQESQVINDIDQLINSVKKLKENIKQYISSYNKMVSLFDSYKVFIPEFKDRTCEIMPDSQAINNDIDILISALTKKKSYIEFTDFDVSASINEINQYKKEAETVYYNQKRKSEELEAALNDSDKSRKKLHRRICNARFNQLVDICKSRVAKINDLTETINNLEKSIKEKEGKSKKSKKEIVIKDLKKYLDYFFHNKYTFDDSNFSITFKNEILNNKTKDVLSEGEKSILALCYYFASTHVIISNEQEYDDLFFVLDDPISSMDFKYVYAVASIIRGLKKEFPQIGGNIRCIIFTHNAEFMSLLVRNKIPNLKLGLVPGKIDKLKNELLQPYEYHLKDLLEISEGRKMPSHTTPNSIRHVIETIMRFEEPNKENTEDYVNSNEILNKNAFIYSVMQDGSHGAMRKQPTISTNDLKRAADTVVDFVKAKYPEQICSIKDL